MRTLIVFCFLIACGGMCIADYYSQNYAASKYYCKDLHRQQTVDISQLEGMWYLIEKIVHNEERHLRVNLTTCPVIHISEDRSSSTTYNPLYKTYDTTYGAGYPHTPLNEQNHRNPTDPQSTFESERDFMKQMEEYDRRTTHDYERRRTFNSLHLKSPLAMKYLKLYMTDGSSSIEHHLRYNITNAGFWIISGQEDGTPDNLKLFAGNTQVLKAVGNHLVLTTCQSSRETKELYTMILSRENYLGSSDINSVHRILINQNLKTHFVEKSCNGAALNTSSLGLGVLILVLYTICF